MGLFSRIPLPKWVVAVIVSMTACVLIVKYELIGRLTGVLKTDDTGPIATSVRRGLGEGEQATSWIYGWIDRILAPVRNFAASAIDTVAKPITGMSGYLKDSQGNPILDQYGKPIFQKFDIKSEKYWSVLFNVAVVLGVIMTFMKFWSSVFPRKYEYQSRDYSKKL